MRTIRQWLASEESGEPFCHCIRCELPLLEVAAPWLVNKEFHRSECVLEYAICQPCRDRVTEEFSEESKATVRDFLERAIDWDERTREFMMHQNPANRFDDCIACRRSRDEVESFGISALYDSEGHLQHGPLPLLICTECIGKATEGLSKTTRDAWQRFLDEHFDGPPGDQEAMPGSGLSGLM